MERFDPALHYGPNDAGVSAISIVLVILALIVGTWAVGAIYGRISTFITNMRKNKNE
tara:strand:- start:67 stop:237 length:171 start_codon:yes stop_codon:yes gene_type:complete